jgi:hypothetical protein
MRLLRILGLVPLLLSLSSCSEWGRGTEGAWGGTIETLPNGASLVSNPAQGLWAEGEAWRIEEELRIGAADGDGPEVFGRISHVAPAPNGEVFVLDGHAQQIRVFGPDGSYRRTFGAEGAGPGELRQAYGLTWDAGGRLWVPDAGNARYSVFDSTGAFLRAHPRRFGVVLPWLGGFDRHGVLHDPAAASDRDGLIRYTFFRVDSIGEVLDSLPALEYRPPQAGPIPVELLSLRPRLTFRFDPAGYLWFGETGRYRIYQRTLGGDTVRIIQLSRDRAPVSAAERDSVMRVLARSPFPVDPSLIPAHKPAFDRIHVDGKGNLFVQPIGSEEETGRVFDVFDREGRYLGAARSDVRFETLPPPLIQGDHAYGVTTDEAGVPYAVRARIVRPHVPGQP